MYYFNYQKNRLLKDSAFSYVWFTHVEYEKHKVEEEQIINSLKKVSGIFVLTPH